MEIAPRRWAGNLSLACWVGSTLAPAPFVRQRRRPEVALGFLVILSSPSASACRSIVVGAAAGADCVIPKIQKKAQSAGGEGFSLTFAHGHRWRVANDQPADTE